MKRTLFSFILAGLCVPALQTRADNSVQEVTLKDGVVCTIQDEQLEPVTKDVQLPFDVTVNTNGTFTVADGKERGLQEGQIIRSDGWLLNPDGSAVAVIDHVTMKAGNVIIVRDGQAEPLKKEMTFPNSMQLSPDGSCIYPGGERMRLVDGQLFKLDGTPISPKDAITFKNGQVTVQKSGSLIHLSKIQTMGLANGSRVTGDGTIRQRDGTTTALHEGQTILVDGIRAGPRN